MLGRHLPRHQDGILPCFPPVIGRSLRANCYVVNLLATSARLDQFPVTRLLSQADDFQALSQAFQFVTYLPTLPSNGQRNHCTSLSPWQVRTTLQQINGFYTFVY